MSASPPTLTSNFNVQLSFSFFVFSSFSYFSYSSSSASGITVVNF
jgi:hypothetical protein